MLIYSDILDVLNCTERSKRFNEAMHSHCKGYLAQGITQSNSEAKSCCSRCTDMSSRTRNKTSQVFCQLEMIKSISCRHCRCQRSDLMAQGSCYDGFDWPTHSNHIDVSPTSTSQMSWELCVWVQAGKHESIMLLWLQRRPGPFEAFLNVPR